MATSNSNAFTPPSLPNTGTLNMCAICDNDWAQQGGTLCAACATAPTCMWGCGNQALTGRALCGACMGLAQCGRCLAYATPNVPVVNGLCAVCVQPTLHAGTWVTHVLTGKLGQVVAGNAPTGQVLVHWLGQCQAPFGVWVANLVASRVQLTKPVTNNTAMYTMWEAYMGGTYIGRVSYWHALGLWQVVGWPVGTARQVGSVRTVWAPQLLAAVKALVVDNAVTLATPVGTAVYNRGNGRCGTLVSQVAKDAYGYVLPNRVMVLWAGSTAPLAVPAHWLVTASWLAYAV